MKKKLSNFSIKIVLTLFVLVGIISSCETLTVKNTPNADYVFKGTIIDSTSTAKIQNIRVISTYINKPARKDTVYSDKNGNYQISYNEYAYESPSFELKVEDIDGFQNGGEFSSQTTKIYISDKDWVNSGDDDWYYGKAIRTTNYKLIYK